MRALCMMLLVACTASHEVRFANKPVVIVVDDRRDVPAPPAKRTSLRYVYQYDGTFHRRISRALELPRDRRALGVNALDEVPDSTWFTNRIGVRDLSLDELRRGPTAIGSPEAYKPWAILSAKSGGTSIGFVIRDTRGRKWLLKPERKGYPEAETAAHVIVNKLLWAAGYNVPEDHVVYVLRDELVLAPNATLDAESLDRRLVLCERTDAGAFRAMASHLVDGKALGGHPQEGVRPDDPNDRIPHELRRDLRGAYALFEWLDHTDVQEGNTLDVWVEDGGRHYVKHYLIDFGKSFGVMATIGRDVRRGHAYKIDFAEMLGSFLSVGLVERAWENRRAPVIRGVGLFESRTYDPGAWKPLTPGYVPVLAADRFDKFWGAKILMRFTPEQLRTVVETARFTDPRAIDYVTETLITRQRATALYWFERTSALDRFTIEGANLCFDDLTLAYGLAAVESRYAVTVSDRRGRPIESRLELRGSNGHACTPVHLASDGYTIVEIAARGHAIDIHLARDAAGAPRAIGIWRR